MSDNILSFVQKAKDKAAKKILPTLSPAEKLQMKIQRIVERQVTQYKVYHNLSEDYEFLTPDEFYVKYYTNLNSGLQLVFQTAQDAEIAATILMHSNNAHDTSYYEIRSIITQTDHFYILVPQHKEKKELYLPADDADTLHAMHLWQLSLDLTERVNNGSIIIDDMIFE